MKCSSPYKLRHMVDGNEFEELVGCGQCMPCRINRREQWACRILLESCFHDHSTFVTLTYRDANLILRHRAPMAYSVGILHKPHLQGFMKRFRYHVQRKVRFFAVGEYGNGLRPHYHLVLFGSNALNFHSDINEEGRCIEKAWPHGSVEATPLTIQRARYVAGYTTKKKTRPNSFADGRVPEFSVMSRKPGIAVRAVETMREVYSRYGIRLDSYAVPSNPEASTSGGFCRIDGKLWRLDAFLRGKLSQALGQQTSQLNRALKRNARQYFDSLTPLMDHLEAQERSMTAATEEYRRMKRGQAL